MGFLGNAVPVTEKQLLQRQGEALWVREPSQPGRKDERREDLLGSWEGFVSGPVLGTGTVCAEETRTRYTAFCLSCFRSFPSTSVFHTQKIPHRYSLTRSQRERNGTIALDSAGFPAV